MNDHACCVCSGRLDQVIYDTGDKRSLTSLCRTYPGPTRVRACAACGHLQTDAMEAVEAYYDAEYDILVESEEEDQVYEVRDGVPLFRTTHQVGVLARKFRFGGEIDLLDYGCAKSSTVRALVSEIPSVRAHLFDVSARYVPFWKKFLPADRWAINQTPGHWLARFDLVTSFFSLEHIPRPAETIRHIASLLKPGGTFYAVVPNVLGNIADFIVVDHCNHFTAPSLRRLLAEGGLQDICIDDDSHRGALVVTATKPEGAPLAVDQNPAEIGRTYDRLVGIAAYWKDCAGKVRQFERSLPDRGRTAIYGAGFYGAFIAASLLDPSRVACHIDQNPFLRGRSFEGKPIVAPTELPEDVRDVFVGLNPAHARSSIAAIAAFEGRPINFYYL